MYNQRYSKLRPDQHRQRRQAAGGVDLLHRRAARPRRLAAGDRRHDVPALAVPEQGVRDRPEHAEDRMEVRAQAGSGGDPADVLRHRHRASRRVAGARAGRAHRARAAGAVRGRQRPVLRPGRQDAGRQPARLGAEVRDVPRPHRGQAHRDRRPPTTTRTTSATPSTCTSPTARRRTAPASASGSTGSPWPCSRPTARTSRPGPRGCGPRWLCSADQSHGGNRERRGTRAHPGVVRARVASALRLGVPPGRRRGPRRRDPLPADGRGGARGAPHLPAAGRGAGRGRHRRAPLRLRRHR